MNEIEQKLSDYSKNLGLSDVLTIDELLESHQRQRVHVKSLQNFFNESKQKQYESFLEEFKERNASEFVSIEDLRKMSLQEIFDKFF